MLPTATVLTLSPADSLAIYSAVAHYHLDPSNRMGSGGRHYPVIFVSPNLATSLDPLGERWDGDPTPPGLLSLFNDLAPRVEFATKDAVIQRDKMNAVRDDGIWLGFGTIQVEGNEVRVGVESFLNGMNAAAYRYELAHEGSQWIVLKATQLWIS